MTASSRSLGKTGRFALLASLYIAQGIPFGFATLFVPLQIAERADFSYGKATLVTLASFPWVLKLLWAPATDALWWPRIGRRRSWILPAQALLATTALAAAQLSFTGSLVPIFLVVTLFNLWASVQDTAVDGLAVELLPPEERGLGNVAQVAGYKLGMVAGGSGLTVVATHLGTPAAMVTLALAVLVLMAAPLLFREPPPPVRGTQEKRSPHDVAMTLLRTVATRAWLPTLLFVGTVKVGESMVSNVVKPWLVRENSFTKDEASFAVGVVAMLASLAGSAIGGHLAGKMDRRRALLTFGVIQAAALILLGIGMSLKLQGSTITTVIAVEHFAAGLLTPALFAYMMDVSDPAVGASHYTLLATIEVLAKGAGGAAAGFIVDAVGAGPFALGTALIGLLPLLLLPYVMPPRMVAEPAQST